MNLVRLLPFLFLCVLPVMAGAQAKPANAEKAAHRTGESWLRMVDDAKYTDAWEGCADLLKESVNKAQFDRMLRQMREPLGAVLNRKLKDALWTTQVAGAPEGGYVVLTYNTRFAQRPEAIETLTMAWVEGKWEPTGYFVR